MLQRILQTTRLQPLVTKPLLNRFLKYYAIRALKFNHRNWNQCQLVILAALTIFDTHIN